MGFLKSVNSHYTSINNMTGPKGGLIGSLFRKYFK